MDGGQKRREVQMNERKRKVERRNDGEKERR